MSEPEKQTETPVVKKGNRSWRPSAILEMKSKDPNVRLRWVHQEPANMLKKQAEGWEPADKSDAVHARPMSVESGKGNSGRITEYRDLVLMKMPEELAQARAAYYENETMEQLRGLKRKLADNLDGRFKDRVPAHGKIVIE